ncbi:MAG: ComEC family competence protein [Sphingobacteriaceae bacterium]|nr:MAG: ComEC family competence protein [Sphingobacteriaceae bacterium]
MLANHKGEIPFVLLIVPFLLGIVVGLNFASVNYFNFLLVSISVLSLAFIGLNMAYSRLNLYRIKWLGGSLISLILLLVGWVSVIEHADLNKSDHFSKSLSQYLIAKINNEPVLKNGLIRFTAKVEQQVNSSKHTNTSGNLLISIKDSAATQLKYGDVLLIPASYNLVDPPFNPAEFNYKKYLAHQNIYHQAFLYPKQYVVIEHNKGNGIMAYALQQRKNLVEKFKANMTDTNAIAVASTLILGYKADLSNDILQAYSKTGTIHVLSVSGAHVAILFLLLNYALSFLDGRKYGKLLKAIIIVTLIWYYALLTGFSPAVCRAAVMLSMIIMGKTYSRYINTLNILAISAFFLLLYNPYFITDVGFQLSYLAVAGLVVFQPIVYDLIKVGNKWLDKLWALCSISIAAQVITFPLSAYYFHQFPVYFLVSNLVIALPVMLIMYTGLFYLLLPQIPVVSKSLGFILEQAILWMNKSLTIIEQSPLASISKIWLTTFEYLLLYGIIICLFYFLFDKRKWLIKVSLLCLLVLSISISLKKYKAFKTDSITYLNLRSHTGIIFKNNNKAVIITDINPADKNYKYAVQPYLDSIKVIDTAVYTIDKDIDLPYLKKAGNLMQFNNKRILIYDKNTVNNRLSQKLQVNYLFITDNPKADLNSINKNYTYKLLVIDGSNTPQLIAKLEQQAKEANIPYQSLKRNKALQILSNNY